MDLRLTRRINELRDAGKWLEVNGVTKQVRSKYTIDASKADGTRSITSRVLDGCGLDVGRPRC